MRFTGNDAGGHKVGDDSVTTKKIADNAISYIATVRGNTIDITTHGTVENPTSLVVTAKASVNGLNGIAILHIRFDGTSMDFIASDTLAGDYLVPLAVQFMTIITDSDSHTINFEASDSYSGNGTINILEIRR